MMFKNFRIRLLRMVVVAAVAFIAGLILGFAFCSNPAFAHPGGIAGDGCHNEKATGVRHAHVKMPDGPRISVDCEAWKVITQNHLTSNDGLPDGLRAQLQVAEGKAARERARADTVEAKYQSMMAAADRDRKAAADVLLNAEMKASGIVQEANIILNHAKAREQGLGPVASRSCQQSLWVHLIDLETGWFTDDVRVKGHGRRAIVRDCLGE